MDKEDKRHEVLEKTTKLVNNVVTDLIGDVMKVYDKLTTDEITKFGSSDGQWFAVRLARILLLTAGPDTIVGAFNADSYKNDPARIKRILAKRQQ